MNALEILKALEKIISTAEKFKSAYFWSSPQKAADRRSYEKYWSIPEFTFEYDGKSYSAAYSVECTCNNVYARGIYYRDGKKTTITTLKNIYRKIKEAASNDIISAD